MRNLSDDIPAHKAFGVCRQNWPAPSPATPHLSASDNALRGTVEGRGTGI